MTGLDEILRVDGRFYARGGGREVGIGGGHVGVGGSGGLEGRGGRCSC